MAVTPSRLPELRQDHLRTKTQTLVEKIDAELVAGEYTPPYRFKFRVKTPDDLICAVRDEYTTAGWNATIEWIEWYSGESGNLNDHAQCLQLAERVSIESDQAAANPKVLNVLEFAEALDFCTLSNWQKAILVSIYRGRIHNEYLSLSPQEVVQLCRFTDEDFGDVSDETMASILERSNTSGLPVTKHVYGMIGMRGGSTTLTWIVSLYEVYSLVNTKDAYKKYALRENDVVTILALFNSTTVVGTNLSRPTASIKKIFDGLGCVLLQNELRVNSISHSNPSGLTVRLKIASGNCVGLIGSSIKSIIVFDPDFITNLDDSLAMVQPSMSLFGDDGLFVATGQVRDYESVGVEKAKTSWLERKASRSINNEGVFTFRMPTWLSNPSVNREFMMEIQKQNPDAFLREYGVQPKPTDTCMTSGFQGTVHNRIVSLPRST